MLCLAIFYTTCTVDKNVPLANKKKFEQTLAAGTKVKKLEALGSKIKKLISTNMKNGYISCRKDIFKPKL